MKKLELTRSARIKRLLQNRWLLFTLRAVTLGGYVFTIQTGLFGSAVGSHNFAIIFVWIAWWTALKLFFIPLGGRSWCSICPIPLPGEWLQGRTFFGPWSAILGLRKRWPRRLQGSWLGAAGFLLVGLFGALTLTTPRITAFVLLGVLLLAFSLSLVFERRAFCRYLCPVGSFTGLYAQAAPLEVRVRDRQTCSEHTEKTCYTHCPWGQYPPALKSSANCGLCMECLRVCPRDNIAVNLRSWGSDLGPATKHRLDETFLGLVMLASVLVDAAVFLGPWGMLKTAAYTVGSVSWRVYAGLFLAAALVFLPAVFAAAVWLSRRLGKGEGSFQSALAMYGQALVPLGMMAWIAFTVSFAFSKFSYVLPVLFDPFGWGWHLPGAVAVSGVGGVSALSLVIQVSVLAVGLSWSSRVARRVASSLRAAVPVIGFTGMLCLGMLWLLVG